MDTLVLNTWNELRKELKGFISLRVRDPEDVKDILQEVYIKFQTGIVRIRDPRKITSWLYQITRNTIHDYYRKQKGGEELTDVEVEEHEQAHFRDKISQCLSIFIDRLPALYREALQMVELQQMSQLDFARKLNISY